MPEHLTDADAKRLEIVQLDLSLMKQEMAKRRSAQQRATAFYFASLLVIFCALADIDAPLFVTVAWAASWIALYFLTRESLEIERLRGRLQSAAVPAAASLLGCDPSDISTFGDDAAEAEIESRINFIHARFMWVSFFWTPVVASAAVIWTTARYFDRVLDGFAPSWFLLLAAIIAATDIFRRLRGKRPPQNRRQPGRRADA